MTGEQIWNDMTASIRGRIGQLRFNLWFKDLTVIGFDGETLKVGVPNSLHRAWLQHRNVPMLQQAMGETGQDLSLDMVLLLPTKDPEISEEPSVRVLTRAAR